MLRIPVSAFMHTNHNPPITNASMLRCLPRYRVCQEDLPVYQAPKCASWPRISRLLSHAEAPYSHRISRLTIFAVTDNRLAAYAVPPSLPAQGF